MPLDIYPKTTDQLIGKNTDAAGTGSVFAQLAQIRAYTDSIEGVLGTNADAAATNASIWAMLKTLSAKSGGDADYKNQVTYFQTTNTSSLTNVVNISGKSGYLQSAMLQVGSYSANYQMQIIIDGVIKYDSKALLSGSVGSSMGVTQDTSFVPGSGGYSPRGFGSQGQFKSYPYIGTSNSPDVVCVLPGLIYFSNSLVVVINTVGANATTEIKYATT